MTHIQSKIQYPFLPKDRTIKYVSIDNQYMTMAKEYARQYSKDTAMPTASILVKNEKIISAGANGSDYHKEHGCERVKHHVPTGQGYELCEGCHPKNHSEFQAIKNAQAINADTEGAELYLWGHWWCCESCWNNIKNAGINQVYLLEKSEILFNKEAKGSIVGYQFDQNNAP